MRQRILMAQEFPQCLLQHLPLRPPTSTPRKPRPLTPRLRSAASGRRKILLDFAIAAALLALLLAGFLFARPAAEAIELPLSACDLAAGPCLIELPDGGSLEVGIAPRPIPPLQPLALSGRALKATRLDAISVDFSGIDMNMGYNRVPLQKNGRSFSGQGQLPVCISGRMAWRATFFIDSGGSRFAAPFVFEVGIQGAD